MATIIQDDFADLVYAWCNDIYAEYGKPLKTSHDTELTKTYNWRYVTGISKKFQEWELDEELCKRFLRLAIGKLFSSKLRSKGLSVLHQSNLLNQTYQQLISEIEHKNQQLEIFRRAHNWLNKTVPGDKLTELLKKRTMSADPNLVQWFQAKKLPSVYIAFSKSCSQAYNKLTQYQRLLPPPTELYRLRYGCSEDQKTNFKEILKADWREPCPLPR